MDNINIPNKPNNIVDKEDLDACISISINHKTIEGFYM